MPCMIRFMRTEFPSRDKIEHTVKALLSPRGAYLISDLPEGGLNREGGLLERGGLIHKIK